MSKAELFKPFYIYGRKARYLSTHYFVNNEYIFLKGGVNEVINGYKCVDVVSRDKGGIQWN
ncbi:hypothetical protein LS66_004270 [Helicobacter sp. MIT 03-1614]|uniref:hypothetical protein n=1 Tax=Helicobacter TaxID=209 RepID=UPI00051303C3|nr:hypothetical protein [Helicobacter sp. MIT 03-1614]TLD90080.1 hypothetical protein LS66_004270 [Helicobacter sp. MIT 03-1614]